MFASHRWPPQVEIRYLLVGVRHLEQKCLRTMCADKLESDRSPVVGIAAGERDGRTAARVKGHSKTHQVFDRIGVPIPRFSPCRRAFAKHRGHDDVGLGEEANDCAAERRGFPSRRSLVEDS